MGDSNTENLEKQEDVEGCLKGKVHPGHRFPLPESRLTWLELAQPSTLDFAQAYQALTC